MQKHFIAATLTIAAAALVVGCSKSSTGTATAPPQVGATSQTVTAVGSSACSGGAYGSCTYYFTPTPDTISVGSTLSFTFEDVAHQVTFDTPGAPANLPSEISTTVGVAFPTAGTYDYHCAIHPYMTGVIVVH
jgi:plastocyanin